MNKASCIVYIVDDDPSVRRSLSLLLMSDGYQVASIGSAEELLELELEDYTGEGCIILDIFMDGKSGLELQEEINQKFNRLPIIYISGQGDIPMSVQAMKKGAVNFLEKPVNDLELLNAVEEAIVISRREHTEQQETEKVKKLLNSLTAREYEIYCLLITGMLNKQIAGKLNITEHTVKLHRGKITEKLGVKSVAELVKLAQKINL
jgi:FixJ family two-component response regulator